MINSLRRFSPLLILILALLATTLVYQRGLHGAFVFDDWANIVHNHRIAIDSLDPASVERAAFSSLSGELKRPVSMASFAINHYLHGLDPYYFKLTNLLIHLLNGIGIFVLSRLLLNAYRRQQPQLQDNHITWISTAVAAMWLLHPFNLTGVLYVVQRMASLAALFCIWGLVLFCWGRQRLQEGRGGIAAIVTSILLFFPLALFSKENGVLLPAFMALIEISLFRLQAPQPWQRRFLSGFYLITVVLPAAAALYYLATRFQGVVAGYIVRDFSLAERLMTEARVVWFYLGQIIVPDISRMGLYHDDIAISRSLFEPITTVFAVAGIIGLLVAAICLINKAPLLTFGLLFFFTGHLLESTILPLEIAHEHRNYLPMYGIVLPAVYYLLHPLRYSSTLRPRLLVGIALACLFAFNTFSRAVDWSDPIRHAESEVRNHPDSPRANAGIADAYAGIARNAHGQPDPLYEHAMFHYQRETELDPRNTHGLFGMITLQSRYGLPVDSAWVDELTRRLSQPPFPMFVGPRLVALVECQVEGMCQLSQEQLHQILQAALRNPGLLPVTRANVYTAVHLYRLHIGNDLPGAIDALQQTVAAMPQEPEYRLNLIHFLLMKEQYVPARQQLVQLRVLDEGQRYPDVISDLDKLLSSKGH